MKKMLNLKGKKYVLVEWPECQEIMEYLYEYRPDIQEHCYAVDHGISHTAEEAAWFIPEDALDHLNEE